jgi:hypothetical protein
VALRWRNHRLGRDQRSRGMNPGEPVTHPATVHRGTVQPASPALLAGALAASLLRSVTLRFAGASAKITGRSPITSPPKSATVNAFGLVPTQKDLDSFAVSGLRRCSCITSTPLTSLEWLRHCWRFWVSCGAHFTLIFQRGAEDRSCWLLCTTGDNGQRAMVMISFTSPPSRLVLCLLSGVVTVLGCGNVAQSAAEPGALAS